MKMNPPVLLLAAFVLKVLVLSPSGQAQTTVTDLIDNFQQLRNKKFPTVAPFRGYPPAKCVSIVGPEVLAAVTIATTVTGFVLGLITGVITSQLVQWYRSKAKENRNLRRADLEEENTDDGHSLPLPLTRTDQAGNVHVHYDVPTEGLSVRRPSS
ncbi:uncharacterized protein LOC144873375 isoform X2 [Branchiostoma floridae x Branchiostoma japonicum]